MPHLPSLKVLASRGIFFRKISQWGFLLWCIFIGVRFGIFVHRYRLGGTPGFSRPPSVEAFLPIGSLVGLRHLFSTGVIHPVHPAGVILIMTFFGMSLAAKKSFCSFICPVGTLSERLWKGGEKLFGRTWHLPKWVDIPLRSVKYLLLYLFINIIFFKMPVWGFPSFVLLLFTLGVGWGMLSGHWQTSLTPADYKTLIPLAAGLSH